MLNVALGSVAQAQERASITTPEIIAATTEAAADIFCLSPRISGVCLFLQCTPLGCEVTTTIKVSHFNPALMVTSYNVLGQSPWAEIQAAFGATQVAAHEAQYTILGGSPTSIQGGGRFTNQARGPGEASESRLNKHTIFKDAEVIGAPGNGLSLAATSGLPLACPTTDVAPLFPYFLSGFDSLAWRSGLTEVVFPATFIPGLREVGSFPSNSWGSVHPRIGFINAPEDPKAAAVIAQRAADIATRSSQPHVYVPVGSIPGIPAPGVKVFEPDPVVENDPSSAKWQMLVPVTENTCAPFGENDTLNGPAGWSSNKVSSSGDYAWALWRSYSCCLDAGIFLTDIEFGP